MIGIDFDLPAWVQAINPDGVTVETTQEFRRFSDLFGRFESIGLDCGFGFVQRAYNCEPISLLRWAGMRLDHLTAGLESGWEDLGNIDNMRLAYHDVLERFLLVIDCHGLVFHTEERDPDADQERLKQILSKRIEFLAKKLFSDLRNAEKYFIVYSNLERDDDRSIEAVLGKLQNYNKTNKLLFVNKASDAHQAGMVKILSPWLIRGFVRKPDDIFENGIFYPDWTNLCHAAHEYWSTRP